MAEHDESIKALKAEILKLLPAGPDTKVEFVHTPLSDDVKEWVAVVRVGSDYLTSQGDQYIDTRFEIRATHESKLGAMQKLLAALFRLQAHFTGRPI